MAMTSELRRLLAETAFLSCLMNDTARARAILRGLEVDGVDVAVGNGFADLTDGNAAAASGQFRMAAEAGDADALLLLAVALKADGRLTELEGLATRHADIPKLRQMADSLR